MIPFEITVLQRLGFGYSPAEWQILQKIGFAKYVETQLQPDDKQDTALASRLAAAQLPIEYQHKGQKVKESRPLGMLNKSAAELWASGRDKPYAERVRPAQEVFAASVLRATYSRWQLREVLVDFWHNHFSVNAFADERIGLLFPLHDRAIRSHVFGNFRQLLEAIAQSPSMLYSLNNAHSKASPANENYARELFELHTLGADAYLNELYDRWKDVPSTNGLPVGYIDEDVYEAARAFTGWAVADDSDDGKGGKLPENGGFYYCESRHDPYQKRVLGREFPHHQPPLADGMQVLDLVAYHPATAVHLCTKLCRRLVSDEPPKSLVDKAVSVWNQQLKSPNQIREVVRAVVLSDEFKQTQGQKAKTPLELAVGWWRALELEVRPNMQLYWMLQRLGQRVFGWPTPTGHPDQSAYWLNADLLIGRWNLATTLFLEDWHQLTDLTPLARTDFGTQTAAELAAHWCKRVFGYEIAAATEQAARFLAAGGSPNDPPFFHDERDRLWRFGNMLVLLLAQPAMQMK